MANKCISPTVQTAAALKYFSAWLEQKMKKFDVTDATLAQYVGLERKSILKYRNGQSFPKLDVLVMIYDFFEEDAVYVPFGGGHASGQD